MTESWVIPGAVAIPNNNDQPRVLPLGEVLHQQRLLPTLASGRYTDISRQPYLGSGEPQPTASKLHGTS